jgi:hypothetical protein
MRNAVEKNGAKFIVVIKPTQEDYDKNSHGLNYSTALSGLKDGNYDFIDLFEVAKNLEFRSEHLFIQAGHLSAVGNRMVANEVTKHIQNLLSQ